MAKRTRINYTPHPVRAMEEKFEAVLPKKTGRTLAQWTKLIAKEAPDGIRERAAWLKSEHGMGTNYAKFVAERASGKTSEYTDPPALVEAMYAGKKAPLRPIHDALVMLGLSLGPDVQARPSKTIVPLYRNHVFAQIKPATQKRIDLGLALKNAGRRPAKRLIATGGLDKGDRITHRIPIESVEEIDDTVRDWLLTAYEADG